MSALGQSYPAWLLRGGRRVLEVDGIQFTDSQDQPGTRGGGGGPTQSLLLSAGGFGAVPTPDMTTTGTYNGTSGAAGISYTYPPIVVAAMGGVANMGNVGAFYVAAGLTGASLTDLAVEAYVTDQLGTNVAVWSNTTSGTPAGGALTLNNVPSGDHWTISTGTDLSSGGTPLLSSTAGGIFTILVQVQLGAD